MRNPAVSRSHPPSSVSSSMTPGAILVAMGETYALGRGNTGGMASACPVCGFNASTVSPGDAAAALRSFPRRYKAVLIRPSNDDADDPVARRGVAGWSALDHATWAANAIDGAAQQVHQVLVHDDADVTPPPVDPAMPPRTDSG